MEFSSEHTYGSVITGHNVSIYLVFLMYVSLLLYLHIKTIYNLTHSISE